MSLTVGLLFISFLVLIFVGIPIGYALGASSLIYLVMNGIDLSVIPQKMYAGMDSFVLLCIPGFVLAGNLMNYGGITERIIKFANALFGHIRGGLGLANIGASMVFAGISGTAVADTASIGAILIPSMEKEGYDVDFSAAVTAASSCIGPIIPPSVPMIIAGTLTGISVGKLFIAGIVPGILMGLLMMGLCYYLSVKRCYPKGERSSLKKIFSTFKYAFGSIVMTLIILAGILGGIFTPTEASIVAVVYAIAIGIFVYKQLTFRDILRIFGESVASSAAILLLVGFANVFAWILTSEQIPQMVAGSILRISSNKMVILILINLLLLFVGTFMETISALVILFPVLLAVTRSLGIPDIQFAVMVVMNLVIGLTTPPVGVCLFVASGIGKISLARITKAILPFLMINLLILALVAFIPAITMWLPAVLGVK